MAKKPTVTTLQSGFNSTEVLNSNFEKLRDAFDNTLSLDGSTPNAMEADLDLNNNNIINANSILVNGTDYLAQALAARDAALVAQTGAETAETNAETAESNAEDSETNAATSATNAATSASNASSSASSATASASTATTQAGIATTKASEIVASAIAASASASNAATSASASATSASQSATSASNAASSASSAQASKDAALAALDSFDDRYLGQKASDPTLDNDGDALVSGALYFNTSDDVMKVYEGSVWVAAYASLSGALLQTNNLSDVVSTSASRTNLGLGTAATSNTGDFATAAQGTLADSAVQENDSPSFNGLTVDGDALFQNGGTTAMFWDASLKSLAVGSTSFASLEGVQGISVGSSSNSSSGISFTNGSRNFMLYNTGNNFRLWDSSVNQDRLTITHTGNMGVGVLGPTEKLDVAGTVKATAFSGDGSALTGLPAGYTNSDVDTHLNYSTATTGQVLSYSGSDYDWVDVAAGATGGGSDDIFWENGQNVTTDYTITNGKNAMSAGPITINSGVTVTVGAGEVWTVV